jgi:hypothetical protein
MKMKQILTEHKKLNRAIQHLEFAKDNLYDFIVDDEDAKESIRSWFPIDSLMGSITGSSNSSKQNEGKEMPHSDALKLIKIIDDIIFAIVDRVDIPQP